VDWVEIGFSKCHSRKSVTKKKAKRKIRKRKKKKTLSLSLIPLHVVLWVMVDDFDVCG